MNKGRAHGYIHGDSVHIPLKDKGEKMPIGLDIQILS